MVGVAVWVVVWVAVVVWVGVEVAVVVAVTYMTAYSKGILLAMQHHKEGHLSNPFVKGSDEYWGYEQEKEDIEAFEKLIEETNNGREIEHR